MSPKHVSLGIEQTTLNRLAGDPEAFKAIFADKPLTFLRAYAPHIKWPLKLRTIFANIWLGKAGHNVIMKAPRGGGKSFMLGALGFCQWYFKNKSVVDMGGALEQAKIVYGYFTKIVYSDPNILESLPKDPMMEMTKAKEGHYFKCVAASLKQVRGPHPDVLMADEVCETSDELVDAALPMVDTSEDPLRVLTSTFHKVFGIFQDVWDRAPELGYTRYSWDIFDVVKVFSPRIWDDPKLKREIPDLDKLKALSGGRIGDPEGWVPIENVINAWRGKRTLDWFLVEYMGSRPSISGLVLDPVDVDAASFDPEAENRYNYVKGAECVMGIDWGFSSMTALVELMKHADDVKVQKRCETYTQVPLEVIIKDVVSWVREHEINFIYADSSGKFENQALQAALSKEDLGCQVIEVVFSKDKEEMLGNYRAHFERQKIKIPSNHQVAFWQHKRYQYIEGTNKPKKKDDHIPDATQCALQHWPLGNNEEVNLKLPGEEDPRDISRREGAVTMGMEF